MSASEAKGVVTAFGLIGLVLVLMLGADYFFSQRQQSLLISSPKMLDSLTVSLDNQKPYYADNKEFKANSYEQKVYKHFNFNPNIASVAQLESLGIPKFIAERIEKYRSKGGKFRKKEDLAKIYGLLPDTYERLEPYITLPSAENESMHTPQAQIIEPANAANSVASIPNVPAPAGEKYNPSNKKPEVVAKFDLNTADTTQLKMIKGIGSGYAKRIIKFRDLLGGFGHAEQVRETFGLPPETVDELLKYGFVKAGVKRLKINQLAVSDFRHPYLKFFQAKAIIAYREQHGAFKTIEDLKQIKVLDEETIQKMEPYLEF